LPVEDEIGRVAPVIEQLVRRAWAPSRWTRARPPWRVRAAAGAAVVNDVSGLAFDPSSRASWRREEPE